MSELIPDGSQNQPMGTEGRDFETAKTEVLFSAFKVYNIYLGEMGRQDI